MSLSLTNAPTIQATETPEAPAIIRSGTATNPEKTVVALPSLPTWTVGDTILGTLLTFASLFGFLLYHCGSTRAKNSGHTSVLLLAGVLFGLTGYWIGGFAVQTGGIGDHHAALAQPIIPDDKNALDHELGPVLLGHHWGLMGSAGFFLQTDNPDRNDIALLFLVQTSLLSLALAATIGAALERTRIVSIAFCAFLFGVLVYPLPGNWIWGGGWLAELGREFGLGHGVVDIAGAGVVHETAGTLALVLATMLGPRQGRFGRTGTFNAIPGHNVPFIVLGTFVLLFSWMSANAFSSCSLSTGPDEANSPTYAGLGALNTLLAATGGLVASFVQTLWQRNRPEPARLSRGLLGGAVAGCGGAALIDPWSAFAVGAAAAVLVQSTVRFLERLPLDDPAGAVAVHGASGAWGLLAVGIFANGTTGNGFNSIKGPIRGILFGGSWHQLVAQMIGCLTVFVVVYLLGMACIHLVKKIVGLRAPLASETGGLDWPEIGALGYQGDIDPDDDVDGQRKSDEIP